MIVSSSARLRTWIFLLTALIGLSQLSCGSNCSDPQNAMSAQCVIDGAVVDCTGVSSISSAVSIVQPILDGLLASALQPDGTISWALIGAQIVTLGFQYGMCVISEIWNAYMNGVAPGSGNGSAGSAATPSIAKPSFLARVKLTPADFAAEFDQIRSQVAPGRKFKVRSGATL